jgi:hypothetical protein
MHLFRHAGSEEPALACPVLDTGYSDTGASRPRPDESREPSQRLGPGFHREPWIPAGVYPGGNRGRNDASH